MPTLESTIRNLYKDKQLDEGHSMSPAQQAAIAISKKEKGEKPKDEKDEGNAFGAALQAAKKNGDKTFMVGGKKYDVNTEEEIKEEQLREDGHSDVPSAIRKSKTMIEDANEIMSKLQSMANDDSLPSWWTNKLAVASDSMNKLRDYILNPVEEEVNEDSFGRRRLPPGKRNPDNPIKKMAKNLVKDIPPSRPLKDLHKSQQGEDKDLENVAKKLKGASKKHAKQADVIMKHVKDMEKMDEGRMKDMSMDMKDMPADEFQRKYNMSKADAQKKFGKAPDGPQHTDHKEMGEAATNESLFHNYIQKLVKGEA